MHDGYKVMDSDIHVIEPPDLWQRYLDPQFRDRAPVPPDDARLIRWRVDGQALPAYADTPERQRGLQIRYRPERVGDAPRPRDARAGTTPEAMLAAMEVEGIDVSVVFRTYGAHVIAFDGMDPPFEAALCRAFNRWLAEFCDADRDRLKLGALVPLQDVDLAVEEANVAVRDLGATTLVLPSQIVNGRPLYHPDYDRLWATAQDLNVAVSFHGIQAAYNGGHLATRYLDNHALGHAVGQPIELMLALGAVLTGGVLARHPQLRMAFLEGNCSWLPWWLWALDERFEEWGDRELFQQEALPSDLFRRQCWVSIEPEEELGQHAIDCVGDDNIVISTDWPHDDSRYPEAIQTFLGLETLSDASKRKILWDNCARLYALA